jgi:glycosyltransferase involved in cell wall biosynthesis
MPHTLGARPPLVSVVLPCHVSSATQLARLDEALSSVTGQSCTDHEVIVVDDGSAVDVGPVVASHRRAFLVRQPQTGSALARNAGIDVARGGAFVFLDADDHLLPGALEAGLAALDARPACGFAIGPRLEMHDDAMPGDVRLAVPPDTPRLYVPLLRGDWRIVPPSSAIFRREAVERLGGFRDPWGADDLDFYLRAAWLFEAHCLPAPPLTRYRRDRDSTRRDGEQMLESVRAVYERQWPLVQGHPEGEAAWHAGLRALTEELLACLVQDVRDRWQARNGHDGWPPALHAIEGPARLTGGSPALTA